MVRVFFASARSIIADVILLGELLVICFVCFCQHDSTMPIGDGKEWTEK